MKRKLELFVASLIVIIATSVITAAVQVYRQNQAIRHLERTLSDLKQTEEQLKNTDTQKDQLEQKTQEQQKEIDRLNVELQAKKERQQSLAAAALNTATFSGRAAAAPMVIDGCGDNFYANYIYMRESGCNVNAVNPGGCRGIGQACPGSKLPCGADYACQNAWFTNYANAVYGGWEGAYNFWIANHWW